MTIFPLQIQKDGLSSDCSLQLENIKLEPQVITDQHAAVNMYSAWKPMGSKVWKFRLTTSPVSIVAGLKNYGFQHQSKIMKAPKTPLDKANRQYLA